MRMSADACSLILLHAGNELASVAHLSSTHPVHVNDVVDGEIHRDKEGGRGIQQLIDDGHISVYSLSPSEQALMGQLSSVVDPGEAAMFAEHLASSRHCITNDFSAIRAAERWVNQPQNAALIWDRYCIHTARNVVQFSVDTKRLSSKEGRDWATRAFAVTGNNTVGNKEADIPL